MVLELFEDGSVLISNIKSHKKFKVNGYCIKPYLVSKLPTLAVKVNLRYPEALEDVMSVSPSPHLLS